jgi:peptide/nickel transport system permease protein
MIAGKLGRSTPDAGGGGRDELVRSRSSVPMKVLKSRLGVAGAVLVLGTVFVALLAPAIAPYSPTLTSLSDRLWAPGTTGQDGRVHYLGTDQLGRDVMSRIVYGARVSLAVGVLTVVFAGLMGFSAGVAAGFWGGLADTLVMRVVDLQLAFPFILLAMAVVALLGPSLLIVVIVFVLTSWPIYARAARASTLVVRQDQYVEAARSLGAGPLRILARHILPNILAPLLVVASFEMARVIIVEAAMGFLGLGVPPPTPTWGGMLADGRAYIRDAWWLSTFPGVAIMFLATGVNFLGDALRDALDPRLR